MSFKSIPGNVKLRSSRNGKGSNSTNSSHITPFENDSEWFHLDAFRNLNLTSGSNLKSKHPSKLIWDM